MIKRDYDVPKFLEDQFLNKELASLLKEKGFDEPCFAFFEDDISGEFRLASEYSLDTTDDMTTLEYCTITPFYDQAINWFNKKGIIIYWNMLIDSHWEYHVGPGWPPADEIIPKWIHSKYVYSEPQEARIEAIKEAIKYL